MSIFDNAKSGDIYIDGSDGAWEYRCIYPTMKIYLHELRNLKTGEISRYSKLGSPILPKFYPIVRRGDAALLEEMRKLGRIVQSAAFTKQEMETLCLLTMALDWVQVASPPELFERIAKLPGSGRPSDRARTALSRFIIREVA